MWGSPPRGQSACDERSSDNRRKQSRRISQPARTKMKINGMTLADRIALTDPSELLRPEVTFASKDIGRFRDYSIDETDPIKERVRQTYRSMHLNMTVSFVQEKMAKWLKFDKFRMNVMEALELLNSLVDESDPDVDIPNIVHAFQTAERIRQVYPDDDWFHLTGLIHDLGKIMALCGEPQWCVVGDTFPVGCNWAPSIVYRETSFQDNPDADNPKYNTDSGMYAPECGLDNLMMSWGHDEYMYRVLVHNKARLPPQALKMIRYHSFYPWHTGKDYRHLCKPQDKDTLEWVLKFNDFDLYTKSEEIPDIEQLKPYYQSLIDKYLPGELEW